MITRTVQDAIGTRELASVPAGTAIRTAALVLDRLNIGALVVLDGGRLTGILSERDVIRRCIAQGSDPDTTPVEAAMTAAPETVRATDALSEAIARMSHGSFRHLPVMTGEVCTGILSIRDIPTEYRMMFERFQEMKA